MISYQLKNSKILSFALPSLVLLAVAPMVGFFFDFDLVRELLIFVVIANSAPVFILLSDYLVNDYSSKIKILDNGEIYFTKGEVSERFSFRDIEYIERRHTFLPRLYIIEFYYYSFKLKTGQEFCLSCLTLPRLFFDRVEMREKSSLLPLTRL